MLKLTRNDPNWSTPKMSPDAAFFDRAKYIVDPQMKD